MKRKIMAIIVILLFVAIQFSIVEADPGTKKEKQSVEIGAINSDEIIDIKEVILSEEELLKLESYISTLFEKIQSAKSWQNLKEIINNNPIPNIPILGPILKIFLSKLSLNRGFVISNGRGYDFNILKRNALKIRKKIAIWHYSSIEGLGSKTIILKPLKFNMKVLSGTQFGLMTKFFGIFLHISRNLPEKSHTFFMGTAKHINGIQLPSIS
jgi:hypothetical protein